MHAHTDAHTDACVHAHTHKTRTHAHTPSIDPCSAFTYSEWCRPHPAEQIDWGGRGGGAGDFTSSTHTFGFAWVSVTELHDS